ncbi:MAG: hypothetical protein H0X30_31830 [Anaerolineae bacterium]|nr:hypothetical protein [Anaerolineae bacterium]
MSTVEAKPVPAKRPITVLLGAILLTLVGFMLLVLGVPGILGILERASRQVYSDTPDTVLSVIAMIIVGIMAFAAGIGLLKMRRWGWVLGLIITIGFLLYQAYLTVSVCGCMPFIQSDYTLVGLGLFLLPYMIGVLLIVWHWENRRLFI